MSSTEPTPATPQRRGLRPATLVWGFVLMVLGAGIIAVGLGYRISLPILIIALIAVAGVALLLVALLPRRDR